MNVVGHAHVALILSGEPDAKDALAIALGAALPDLLGVARVRVDPARLSPELRSGVALHHRTDRAFHALAAFRTGVRLLVGRLVDEGLPRGPARAVGHAGWELVLDGSLLRDETVRDRFGEVVEQLDRVTLPLDQDEARRFERFVRAAGSEAWWLGYRDTAVVADRLSRMLGDRRRLAFDVSDVPLVAAVLSEARPEIDAVAGDVVASVVSALSSQDAQDTGSALA